MISRRKSGKRYYDKKSGYVKKEYRDFYKNKNKDCARFTISFHFLASETREKYITISWSGEKYSYWNGSGWVYIKPRKKGWHEVKFQIKENQLSLFFDKEVIKQNIHNAIKTKYLSWRSNTIYPNVEAYSWIDDVKFYRKE